MCCLKVCDCTLDFCCLKMLLWLVITCTWLFMLLTAFGLWLVWLLIFEFGWLFVFDCVACLNCMLVTCVYYLFVGLLLFLNTWLFVVCIVLFYRLGVLIWGGLLFWFWLLGCCTGDFLCFGLVCVCCFVLMICLIGFCVIVL